ncbi:hypothetical protein RHMOL_Rhmol04G0163900 [Rhododendron molle]|uniref:Uncharacterized protein n=1 Tax=Rhododendron molle TaxID=49168 RepID=A0ACC0P2Q7_RHOML|nr:hypothetical protein RHMOL_Rhmol04G0163900 [Rhododendron molle]
MSPKNTVCVGESLIQASCEMENRVKPEEKMAENGGGERQEPQTNNVRKKKKRVKGGIRTMPFILANDACDRFASSGSHANMITYLTNELNMPLVKASNTITNFGGLGSFTPLIGALIADSFAGRFWTIIVGSLIYELGLVSMTLSATLPHLRPPPCPTQENCKEASSSQLGILYLSLLLSSIGSGGIRPCVVTFAADQFDMSKAKVESRKWNFFNWYYFCTGTASLIALTVVVYIQDNVGWGLGLGIPTIVMAVSVLAFVLGSPLYRRVKPSGSPLVRLVQVIVAAVKKRKAVAPEDPSLLWFDRAAIVTEDDGRDLNSPNLWRLATVHLVEELKCIIRMLPIWAAGILLIASNSHQGSFVIVQARSMDRNLISPSFQIPPASMSVFGTLTVLIGLVLYERLFVPFARRYTKNPAGITCLQRMGIGFAVNILATIVSAFVEIKRKQVAAHHGLLDKPTATIPISVFWLLPQFCLHGIAEVFMSVGHLEFLYDQSPESLRSTAVALYWMATSVGNYIGTIIVTLVHEYTGKGKGKKGNWLPDRNLNRGKLEDYYLLVSGIQLLNLVYFAIAAWFYKYKPLEVVIESNGEGDVELAKESAKEITLDDANGNGEAGETKVSQIRVVD